MQPKIKTRIAPSPTGNLHVGTARTALFNWLYARQNAGTFVIRLEDTDKKRSSSEYEKDILDGLSWLGLNSDEHIVRQSEREALYQKYIDVLREKNAVYEEPAREGEGTAIILKKPTGDISFTDSVRGKVMFAEEELQDLVIKKPDGSPTYNFAVVIDDHEMAITHVARGEDHIPNTPKQLMVYQAFGWEPPVFAHLPLMLGTDRSKLSKRHGAQSVVEFRQQGYVPDAMVNFLALMGWHPKDEQEIFTLDELVSAFKLEDVQKGGAVFDVDKLDWINQQHIQRLSPDDYKRQLGQYLGHEVSDAFVHITQPRVKKLSDAKEDLQWLEKPTYEASLLTWKETPQEKTASNLKGLVERIEGLQEDAFKNPETLESHLMPYADEQGRGEVLWPMRVALSGQKNSPGPFELAALVGKDETSARLQEALEKLSS